MGAGFVCRCEKQVRSAGKSVKGVTMKVDNGKHGSSFGISVILLYAEESKMLKTDRGKEAESMDKKRKISYTEIRIRER